MVTWLCQKPSLLRTAAPRNKPSGIFLEMDRDDPDSWYPDPPRRGIMVEIYQHQALWNNRQYPRVHQAFSEIWETEKLWVSFDRASMNPPERSDYKFPGPYLHWDMSLDNMPVTLKGAGGSVFGGYAWKSRRVYLYSRVPSEIGEMVE